MRVIARSRSAAWLQASGLADASGHVSLIRTSLAAGTASQVVQRLQRQFGNAYTTEVVSAALDKQIMEVVPRAIESQILAARGGGRPLDPHVQRQMEAKFQHDFSGVRVHTDATAQDTSQAIDARAFTLGNDVFFGGGEYNPRTGGGRELLAHELAHVVQQAGRPIQPPLMLGDPHDAAEQEAHTAARATESVVPAVASDNAVQRQCACGGAKSSESEECEACTEKMQRVQRAPERSVIRRQRQLQPLPPTYKLPEPEDFGDLYWTEINMTEDFDSVASPLLIALRSHPHPYKYIRRVIDEIGSDHDDELAAAFVSRLGAPQLEGMASTSDGRATLNILYEAMITGSVSDFQREQANKIIMVKLRRMSPEDYVKAQTKSSSGRATKIFPVRFMGILPRDDAPILAKLEPDGKIRVTYPVRVSTTRMFAAEFATLGPVFTSGEVLNPSEIVGIRDYETDPNEVLYLPALALLDYSNRAIQSTSGKIIDVAMFAATFGSGSAIASAGRWGKALAIADRVANVIQVAGMVVNENRQWIIDRFPRTGRYLVQAVNYANTVVAIYGVARLGGAGYKLVKDMRAAAKAAREEASALKQLGQEEQAVLNRLDAETDDLLKDLDAEAAKTGKAAEPLPHVEETAAAKATATETGTTAAATKPGTKPAGSLEQIEASASKLKIPARKLEDEVAELSGKAANPRNVREPRNPAFDAEMDAGGHTFDRERASRTWCRHSNGKCGLGLGDELNNATDEAVAARQPSRAEQARARLEERRQQIREEVAREQRITQGRAELEQRPGATRREPGVRRDDPRWSQQVAQLEESAQFGRYAEQELRTDLRRRLITRYSNVGDQIRIRPRLPNGELADFYFIADHVTRRGAGFLAIDAKLTARAGLTANQAAGYRLLEQYGGVVVSRKAGPFYPHNMVLPPTPGFIATPAINLRTTARPPGGVPFDMTPI